jgi:hypothetical protein
MNELRRMAYLNALGVDCYVSRTQLPGAAVTRRLAIVGTPGRTPAAQARVEVDSAVKGAVKAVSPMPREGIIRPDFGVDTRKAATVIAPPPDVLPGSEPVPRFSLSIIAAGDWLWLEERDGMPLTTEQVQLVQAMAQALVLSGASARANPLAAEAVQAAKPVIAQFDWPIHNNRQLDQGEEAARAGVAAFVSRRLEEHRCRGLVLLGASCARRVPLEAITTVAVSTASSADILANPAIKSQVWRDLQPLRGNT